MSEPPPSYDELLAQTRQQAQRVEQLEAELARLRQQLEQALRPAVVNRTVWGGNRTWTGAQAQGTLLSVLRTRGLRGAEALTWLRQTLCSAAHVVLPSAR